MKKLMKSYLRWRILRTYRKLFWFYAERTNDSDEAGRNAGYALQWLYGVVLEDVLFPKKRDCQA